MVEALYVRRALLLVPLVRLAKLQENLAKGTA